MRHLLVLDFVTYDETKDEAEEKANEESGDGGA